MDLKGPKNTKGAWLMVHATWLLVHAIWLLLHGLWLLLHASSGLALAFAARSLRRLGLCCTGVRSGRTTNPQAQRRKPRPERGVALARVVVRS